ncbi:MAG: hypothetical protein KY475_19950 [Planctomycetes bacterium]|nr:hypothetical protein [Planctomycetota bacterium]
MKYTVTWSPRAQLRLADIWLKATDRAAIAAAANRIDAELGRGPFGVGDARRGGARFLSVPPLCVLFDVSPDDMRVEVWAVWRGA